MLWPESLKEQVRERVGGRGLTRFTLEAVQAKLNTHDVHQADSKELNQVKDLAQRLADAIAMGGDYEDPEETLRYIDLPSWIQTVGWPDSTARVVSPEDSTSELVDQESDEPEPPEPPDHPFDPSHTGMVCEHLVFRDGGGDQCGLPPEAHTSGVYDADGYVKPELPAVGDPDTIRSTPPKAAVAGSLLERIQAKAAEKGVDLSGVDLKPASTVRQLTKEERDEKLARITGSGELTVIPAENLEPDPEPPAPVESIANPDACPECGSELVGGECWECE